MNGSDQDLVRTRFMLRVSMHSRRLPLGQVNVADLEIPEKHEALPTKIAKLLGTSTSTAMNESPVENQ